MSTLETAAREHHLRALALAAAEAEGCLFVSVAVRGGAARDRIEVTVDRAGGVGVEDCARVSRRLKAALTEIDPLEHPYVLEVSSPGLTRTLESPAEYRIFRGRLALLQLRSPLDGQTQLRGALAGPVDGADETVRIADERLGRTVDVPLAQVAWARLDFDPAPRSATAPRKSSGAARRSPSATSRKASRGAGA